MDGEGGNRKMLVPSALLRAGSSAALRCAALRCAALRSGWQIQGEHSKCETALILATDSIEGQEQGEDAAAVSCLLAASNAQRAMMA